MGFKSFLSSVGHKAEVVLKYVASPAGQKTVQIAEAAAVTVGTAVGGPALGASIAGVELLINKAFTGVINMEATAAALGAQSGTGLQKGAAVAAALSPQVEQLLKTLGYDNPTADQVELIANQVSKSMADIVNSIPPPAELQDASSGLTAADQGSSATILRQLEAEAQQNLKTAAQGPATSTTGMVTR
jgi:hypothetical protein